MSYSESTAEEESTKLHNCWTPAFSRTVFREHPIITSSTTFENLPTFKTKLAYKDVLESLECQDPPFRPQLNGNSCASPTASPTYTKVHFTRAELNKYQKMCNDLLKDTTPNMEDLKKFISQMIELIKQITAEHPTMFSVKPVYMVQPVRLTFDNLEDHQEKWEKILQNLNVSEMKEYMQQTMQKMEQIFDQIKYYEKEMDTLRESARHREVMTEQNEYLKIICQQK